MIQQAEGLKHNPSLMLIDDADKPAKWYFALKQARLDSAHSNAALRHWMDGVVELHWRSQAHRRRRDRIQADEHIAWKSVGSVVQKSQ